MTRTRSSRSSAHLAKTEAAVKAAERDYRRARQELERLARRIADAQGRAKRERRHAKSGGGAGKHARATRAAAQLAALLEERQSLHEKKKRAHEMLRARKEILKREKARERDKAKAMRKVERLWTRARNIEPESSEPRVSGTQLRAARGMLGMSRKQFADWLGITDGLVRRIENPTVSTKLDSETVAHIVDVLLAGGIELIPAGVYVGDGGEGVRLRSPAVHAKAGRPKSAGGAAGRRNKRRRVAA